MKKMITAFFAAALMLSACGGSSDDTSASDAGGEASAETTVAATDSAEPAADDSGDDAGEGSGDLSADELALATALTDEATVDADNPFTVEEIRCANEAIVRSVGLEALNSYGISVETPDDTLLPDEFEVQQKALASITGCVNIGSTFRALAPPGCDIPLSDDEMELAMEYDFLSSYPEYDNATAADASAAMQSAIETCSGG